MQIDKPTKLFFILGGFFITNALLAEFVGVKIFSLEATLGFSPFEWTLFGVEDLGFNLTAGVVLWPVIFVMTDIINEYYGKSGVKKLTYLTIGLIIYAFLMVSLSMELAPNEWWDSISGQSPDGSPQISSMNAAFKAIFGQGLWIILGSLCAFIIGQWIDVFVFQKIKKMTGETKIWLRATGSTLVSQLVDSFIVLIIAFYIGSDWDITRVLAIGCVNYLYKFAIAIMLTPIIYFAHYIIDQYLGIEVANSLKAKAIL